MISSGVGCCPSTRTGVSAERLPRGRDRYVAHCGCILRCHSGSPRGEVFGFRFPVLATLTAGNDGLMYEVRGVDVPRRPVAALEDVIGLPRTTRLVAAAASSGSWPAGRVVWNVSSTASGGGVADMLQVLVGYTKDLAIDVRWMVIGGDTEFFRITKRLHNRIHGQPDDWRTAAGAAERRTHRRRDGSPTRRASGRHQRR